MIWKVGVINIIFYTLYVIYKMESSISSILFKEQLYSELDMLKRQKDNIYNGISNDFISMFEKLYDFGNTIIPLLYEKV